jgi:hypothetical protein
MARKPAPPHPAGGSATDQRERGREDDARDELVGLVAIVRHVKDDGRALILYTRAPGAPE